MLAERLDKAWGARRGSTAIDPVMRFSEQGLVLGAGTVLAKSAGSGREISIDPAEPRLQALLAAAHMRRPTERALAHLRKAAERRSEGQDALAAMHLALSQLDRLAQPETDAHRLFLADGLLNAGFEASAIIGAVEAGFVLERLRKYDPDQPRVPAGSGRPSGQWTSADGDAFVGSLSGATSQSIAESLQGVIETGAVAHADYHDACREAYLGCLGAAFKVNNRSANDNRADEDPQGLISDGRKCEQAQWVCSLLSMTIEDIPLLDYGGVIFPHNGVVIMKKGYQDRYIPPLPDGSRPAFRRKP